MSEVNFFDLPALLYCFRPRPSSVLRSRFGQEAISRLSDLGMIHVIDYGFDFYHLDYRGDAIIQISPDGRQYLFKLAVSILVGAASAIAAILMILK